MVPRRGLERTARPEATPSRAAGVPSGGGPDDTGEAGTGGHGVQGAPAGPGDEEAPMSHETADRAAADAMLKARHRAMWATGDFQTIVADVVHDHGPILVEAAGVQAGDTVLDIGAGSGNVAIPAAAAGARVTASDLTPELLDAGRRLAEARGLDLAWEVGDAEALPYADGSFDRVLSCAGVMFAPHHQQAADELVRVCRPGGTIGLITWTPEGLIGRMFAVMAPFVPPPPPGAQPPPLWGREDYVRGLLGDRVTDLTAQRRALTVDRFATGAEFRDYYKQHFGPTIVAYRGLADDTEKTAALDAAIAALANDYLAGQPPTMEWEYLLVTATAR